MYENIDLTGLSAVIYCRKSTESEDRQVQSLKDQESICREIADRYKLSVKKVLRESRSAKEPGRPVFDEMIQMVNDDKVKVIVTWHPNRLSRNPIDSGRLQYQLSKKQISAIVTPSKAFFNSDDIFMLNIEFGSAKKKVDDLSRDVARGMHSRAKTGTYPGVAKPGYRNVYEKGKLVSQEVDEERFYILQKAIRLVLEGVPAPLVLRTLNDDWGYKTPRTTKLGGSKMVLSKFYKLLHSPHIYGQLVFGTTVVEMDERLPRLITEEEYWIVQEKIGKKGLVRPQMHLDVPYRGMIRCGDSKCGCMISPYVKIKQLSSGEKKAYYYAKCSKRNPNYRCKQPSMPLRKLEEQIVEVLQSISISEDFFELALEGLREQHSLQENEQDRDHQRLLRRRRELKNSLNELLNLKLANHITTEEYANKKGDIHTTMEKVDRDIRILDTRTEHWLNHAEKAFDFAKGAVYAFQQGDFETRTSILRTLGSNFTMNNGKLALELNSPYVVFKENHELVNKTLKRFEPEETVTVAANNGLNDSLVSSWYARRESNPRHLG